jgi:hypothetical protein
MLECETAPDTASEAAGVTVATEGLTSLPTEGLEDLATESRLIVAEKNHADT